METKNKKVGKEPFKMKNIDAKKLYRFAERERDIRLVSCTDHRCS